MTDEILPNRDLCRPLSEVFDMKKIFLFVCLALVIAVILFFSIPVPIVSHPDSSKIEWIMVNPDFGNPDSIPLDISISDDVEQEILEYLHQ